MHLYQRRQLPTVPWTANGGRLAGGVPASGRAVSVIDRFSNSVRKEIEDAQQYGTLWQFDCTIW